MKRTRAWSLYVGLALGGFASGLCSGQSAADGLSACTSVADEKSRLKCYDEQMARAGKKVPESNTAGASTTPGTSTTAGTSAAPDTSAASPKPPTASSRPSAPPATRQAAAGSGAGDFGLEGEALRKKREAENRPEPEEALELTARVKRVSERARGEYRIELDNGQVWVETLRTGGLAPNVGEDVVIKRGLMGSFYLTRKAGHALRVKRIK